jgi:hypothetical protein
LQGDIDDVLNFLHSIFDLQMSCDGLEVPQFRKKGRIHQSEMTKVVMSSAKHNQRMMNAVGVPLMLFLQK